MSPTTSLPRYLTLVEAAEAARRTPNAMRQLRFKGKGPKFRNIDGKLLVSEDDLAAWLSGEADEAS